MEVESPSHGVNEPQAPDERHVTVQLVSEAGAGLGAPFHVPLKLDTRQLSALCNGLLKSESVTSEADFEPLPFSFYVKNGNVEIDTDLESAVSKSTGGDLECLAESVIDITYQPQAVFRHLASGSGDCTVRLWDLTTELPLHTLRAHKHWVLCVAWAPDGRKLASACKNGLQGTQLGKPMAGHKQWVTALAWQPLHLDPDCRQLASSGKDCTVRIWDIVLGQCLRTLSGHTAAVTCLQWGGTGLIYTASQDRTVKVWRSSDGTLCRTLSGHAHWVNTMALSSAFVLRTGAFEPKHADSWTNLDAVHRDELAKRAERRYDALLAGGTERLVSGSDDFTLFLWRPAEDKKPVARMTGHMQLVNQVVFSPDSRTVASASFDKSIKLWCGRTGKYLASLHGHVQAVYQVAFSSDSRLLVSGSKDSTIKVWSLRTSKLLIDMPGHADEVYAVDWSTDGQRVASGSKDKLLRIWRR